MGALRRLALVLVAASVTPAQEPQWIPGTTVKVCQITGDRDATRKTATASLTATRFGFPGTDLGSSFEHAGKLWFLFGDTPGRPGHRDLIAWTEAERAEDLVLAARVAADGKFEPLTVPRLGHGPYEIPTCGISHEEKMWVLFTAGHSKKKTMERSVLAVSEDEGRTFRQAGELSRKHFINAAMAHPRPGDDGSSAPPGILVFGTGDYRQSSPRLCVLRSTNPIERSFLAETRPASARWSEAEDEAAPLFDHPVCGEISVAWIEPLRRWVMLYNSTEPRGIVMRLSPRPEGPWSAPTVVFDPWRDGGYPQFMHVSWKHARLDAFQDPRRENEWGGEYGPFLIPRFTRGDASRATLFFVLSTWNPYQVVLMRTDVGAPRGAAASRPSRVLRTLPGSEEWTSPPGFFEGFERAGKRHVTTFTERRDAATGVAWLDLKTERRGSVSFSLHGGQGEVVLVAGRQAPPAPVTDPPAFYERLKAGAFGRVLEAVSGANSNGQDIPIRWSLDHCAGQPLRLYVIDHLADAWGFVSVSEIAIEGATR
jgi:Domain of unknown function (DUF4185)